MLKASALQMKPQLGNIEANCDKILSFYDNSSSDIVITPELALCGYSPLDNIQSPNFQEEIKKYINIIIYHTKDKAPALILGTVWFEDNKIYNVALVIENGKIQNIIYKNKLPNYGVFNEYRYFSTKPCDNLVAIKGKYVAIFVCEDMWHTDLLKNIKNHNAYNLLISKGKIDLIISINASPFEIGKQDSRLAIVKQAQEIIPAPVLYLNLVGGVDDVIFDGNSFVRDSIGMCKYMLHAKEDSLHFEVKDVGSKKIISTEQPSNPKTTNKNQLIFETIQLGLKDFLSASNFKGVIIGMSGGIDSTITAAIAKETLGAENVLGISMPSKHTSQLSYKIIEDIKNSLGIKIIEIPIDNLVESYIKTLENNLNLAENNILDNIQARIRGQILMSYANQYNNFMVLTTGNKSEIATGYCTLYGDTCGGYNLLKDLYKTQVFELAKWMNEKFNNIPIEAITRKPSAELKENQYDEDSLMDYNILDAILYEIIEKNSSLENLYKLFDNNLVNKVLKLLKNSHYKRLQSAMGVNISTRPFGKSYQYNISDGFKR
ncbi:MAG: NAD+ synthase [Alphaproteobacteria bacterium]|jgi:NAD+ synthetase|nr:NAD+ synthase [Alphaproteobacteria bacterium]